MGLGRRFAPSTLSAIFANVPDHLAQSPHAFFVLPLLCAAACMQLSGALFYLWWRGHVTSDKMCLAMVQRW